MQFLRFRASPRQPAEHCETLSIFFLQKCAKNSFETLQREEVNNKIMDASLNISKKISKNLKRSGKKQRKISEDRPLLEEEMKFKRTIHWDQSSYKNGIEEQFDQENKLDLDTDI